MTNKEILIQSILQVCKASDKCPITGELFLGLATASEDALKMIARELYIPVDKICKGT